MAKVISYTKAGVDALIRSHEHVAEKITDFVNAAKDVVGGMIVGIGGTYDPDTKAITLPPLPNATSTVVGGIRLTNHLSGSATSPTVRSATESVTGIVELATSTEATAGTDNSRAVTPQGLKAAINNRPSSETVAKIWTGTQSAYDAITTKDPATLYFIK